MKYYRVKNDSKYHKDLMQAKKDEKALYETTVQVREEFGLPESNSFSNNSRFFYQDKDGLSEELFKQFKNDGVARKNSAIHKRYIALVSEKGLENALSTSMTNFSYGVMRHSHSETMQRFWLEDSYYLKTNTQLSGDELKHLENIKEVEFLETQLRAAKSLEANKE